MHWIRMMLARYLAKQLTKISRRKFADRLVRGGGIR